MNFRSYEKEMDSTLFNFNLTKGCTHIPKIQKSSIFHFFFVLLINRNYLFSFNISIFNVRLQYDNFNEKSIVLNQHLYLTNI